MDNDKISFGLSNFSLCNILHVPFINIQFLSLQQFYKIITIVFFLIFFMSLLKIKLLTMCYFTHTWGSTLQNCPHSNSVTSFHSSLFWKVWPCSSMASKTDSSSFELTSNKADLQVRFFFKRSHPTELWHHDINWTSQNIWP